MDFLGMYGISINMEDDIGGKFVDLSEEGDYWVLMRKDLLPESQGVAYHKQLDLVDELGKKANLRYEVPTIRVTIICLLAHYLRCNERLLGSRYTRSKERNEFGQLEVGCFRWNKIFIEFYHAHCDSDVGITPILRLK